MTVCYWCGAKDTIADVGKELDDGKYKMVQCSKCKNAYYVLNKEKMNKQKPQTNEEWLRSATTEQFATFLAIVQYDGTDLTLKKNHVEKWVEWLKEKHHEV